MAEDAQVLVQSEPKVSRARRSPYADLEEDSELQDAIRFALPERYHFEIPKTIWKIRKAKARNIGLQMPDGLLLWATQIAAILKRFGAPGEILTVTIMGDVNFGACCIDDLGGAAIGVDFLVHYGHSCLVPVDQTVVKTMYVFVRIDIDIDHFVETVKLNFTESDALCLIGTVQFNAAVFGAYEQLKEEGFDVVAPQAKPLSQGETLGCTSPLLPECDACISIADGRFHLEAAMMHNREVERFYRYDPYTQVLTTESYAHDVLDEHRFGAIERARHAKVVGLILGTLGRQGSVGVLEGVRRLFDEHCVKTFVLLLSEITKEKLALFPNVDAWVQVACPRLSTDWGHYFDKPLLTSYEAHSLFTDLPLAAPMDYYANQGGSWSNYGVSHGGSCTEKFWHLSHKAKRLIGYE